MSPLRCIKSLKLDGPTLADIYLGKVKKWNDPAIKALNPAVRGITVGAVMMAILLAAAACGSSGNSGGGTSGSSSLINGAGSTRSAMLRCALNSR